MRAFRNSEEESTRTVEEAVLNEVTACGGVLIMAIGINSLKLLEIRISNQLPAVLVAGVLAYYFI